MISWLLLPVLLLLLARLLPDRLVNCRGQRTAVAVSWFSSAHLPGAICVLVASLQRAGQTVPLWSSDAAWSPSLYLDGTAGLMLTLVAFIGWVIARYSVRYLDGEARQGSYSLWLSLTVGAVSMLAVSGDLLTLFVAWSLAGLGIHKLLTHYSERPAARSAAWLKFMFGRLGDCFLVSAGVMIYREFGTLELASLFAGVSEYATGGLPDGSLLPSIGAMLITGAAVKTAQFPFHTWLPETLEAPTPVSALMHAGIVNAGGYLLIRLHTLLAWSPGSLTALALLGALTACFAATVMLTQASIKKSLAWSTIAQMGFMMLQCGLGAFSAAMLHILAHSVYKAHAFLNSGDVLNQAAGTRGAATAQPIGARAAFVRLAFVVLAVLAVYVGVASLCGLDLAAKPGGFLLGLILSLGLARLVWLARSVPARFALPAGLASAAILSAIYVGLFVAVDSVVSADATGVVVQPATGIVAAFAVGVFLTLFLLETWLSLRPEFGRQATAHWLRAAYVHASNGFYIDAAVAGIVRPLTSHSPRPSGTSLIVK
ncbi:MAG: proton-conducting transporter transmembrane domain-containing protein [Planctomycetota bacterium]|jgi:NAD(P)H-quinone oxidoreductase subunit 5